MSLGSYCVSLTRQIDLVQQRLMEFVIQIKDLFADYPIVRYDPELPVKELV